MNIRSHGLNALLISSLLLTGCASANFHFWKHPAKTDESDYKHDRIECLVKAGQAGVQGPPYYEMFYEECMEGMGWKQEVIQRKK